MSRSSLILALLIIIYYIVKGLDWSNKKEPFKADNTSMHVLNISNGKLEFIEENKIDHLYTPNPPAPPLSPLAP